MGNGLAVNGFRERIKRMGNGLGGMGGRMGNGLGERISCQRIRGTD